MLGAVLGTKICDFIFFLQLPNDDFLWMGALAQLLGVLGASLPAVAHPCPPSCHFPAPSHAPA